MCCDHLHGLHAVVEVLLQVEVQVVVASHHDRVVGRRGRLVGRSLHVVDPRRASARGASHRLKGRLRSHRHRDRLRGRQELQARLLKVGADGLPGRELRYSSAKGGELLHNVHHLSAQGADEVAVVGAGSVLLHAPRRGLAVDVAAAHLPHVQHHLGASLARRQGEVDEDDRLHDVLQGDGVLHHGLAGLLQRVPHGRHVGVEQDVVGVHPPKGQRQAAEVNMFPTEAWRFVVGQDKIMGMVGNG